MVSGWLCLPEKLFLKIRLAQLYEPALFFYTHNEENFFTMWVALY